jgi:hypothetical protein
MSQDQLEPDKEFDLSQIIPEEMTVIKKDIFEDIDLATFYHFIFGKGWCQKNSTGSTFYVNYQEELGNFDIEIVRPLTHDPPHFLRMIE